MSSNVSLNELIGLFNDKNLAEVGGGHNQKGVDFQRHWAVMRMFELDSEGEADFLFLFEALQDIAVLDSCSAPTRICLYQIKKKERKEWGWADLTSLPKPTSANAAPSAKSNRKKKPVALNLVQTSPIGKIYAAVNAIKITKSQGRFVSNAGCDLPLGNGGNAATSEPISLADLSTTHRTLLSDALQTMHKQGDDIPDLSRIYIERTNLPVEGMGPFLVGLAHDFLEKRSQRHAGQARALVDALLAKVGPLGRKTNTCHTFDQMQKQRGFAKADFVSALAALQEVPDRLALLEHWLTTLTAEGCGFMEVAAIRSAAAAIYRRQVMAARTSEEIALDAACDAWLATQPDPGTLRPFFAMAHQTLKANHSTFSKAELYAHIALRALHKCAVQI
jgi:hypothetical protein